MTHLNCDEIKNYYLSLLKDNEDEIISDLTPKTFDIYRVIEKYRRQLKLGKRLLDIGGGLGYFANEMLERGYDVVMTDIIEEFIERSVAKYPKLKGRVKIINIFDEKKTSELLNIINQFDIIVALGSVLNHASSKEELEVGFYNILKFGNTNSLFVIDFLIEEMFPEKPKIIWSDYKHTLVSLFDVGSFIRKYGLRILDVYSIHETYSLKGKYTEHSLRFFIYKPW